LCREYGGRDVREQKEANGIAREAFFGIAGNTWLIDGFAEKLSKASEICHQAELLVALKPQER
jgi:hypothetical protein